MSNELDVYKAEKRFQTLKAKGAVIDLTEKTFKSRNQNSYFHLALQFFGSEIGYSLDEAKQICKNYPCKEIYWKTKNGLKICRSTADLQKEEMTIVIDRFITYAAVEAHVSIPPADRTEFWKQFEIDASKNPHIGA